MLRFKVEIPSEPQYSSSHYYRGSVSGSYNGPIDHITNNGIGASRYASRARAIKRNDPGGVYSSFNLSNNKAFSHKPTLSRGEIIFG